MNFFFRKLYYQIYHDKVEILEDTKKPQTGKKFKHIRTRACKRNL